MEVYNSKYVNRVVLLGVEVEDCVDVKCGLFLVGFLLILVFYFIEKIFGFLKRFRYFFYFLWLAIGLILV